MQIGIQEMKQMRASFLAGSGQVYECIPKFTENCKVIPVHLYEVFRLYQFFVI